MGWRVVCYAKYPANHPALLLPWCISIIWICQWISPISRYFRMTTSSYSLLTCFLRYSSARACRCITIQNWDMSRGPQDWDPYLARLFTYPGWGQITSCGHCFSTLFWVFSSEATVTRIENLPLLLFSAGSALQLQAALDHGYNPNYLLLLLCQCMSAEPPSGDEAYADRNFAACTATPLAWMTWVKQTEALYQHSCVYNRGFAREAMPRRERQKWQTSVVCRPPPPANNNLCAFRDYPLPQNTRYSINRVHSQWWLTSFWVTYS